MNRMKPHLIALIVSIILLIAGYLVYQNFLAVNLDAKYSDSINQLKKIEKENLPAMEVVDLHGVKHNFADFKDHIILISFWASWCAPCIDEFPALKKLTQINDKVVLLALSLDESRVELENFLKLVDISGKDPRIVIALDDDKKISTYFGVLRLPETFIYDRQGKFTKKIVGAIDWLSADSQAYFKKLASQQP